MLQRVGFLRGSYTNIFIDVTTLVIYTILNKSPYGKWTRKPLAYRDSNIFYLYITRPPVMCQLLFLNISTQLAVTQSVDN